MAVAELTQNEINELYLSFAEFIDDPENPAFFDIAQNAFMSTQDYFDEGGSELALNLGWAWES